MAYAIDQLSYTEAESFLFEPSISDDGSRIAVLSNADLEGSGRNADAHTELFLYDVETSQFRQLTDGFDISWGCEIELSGDGNRIAFASKGDFTGDNSDGTLEVFLFDVRENHITQVTNNDSLLLFDRLSLDYSGSRLAFQLEEFSSESGTSYVSYLADLSGASPAIELLSDHSYTPAISGDGSTIVFSSTRDLGENPEHNVEVFLYDVASGAISQVTHTADAVSFGYSIDGAGRQIALTVKEAGDSAKTPFIYNVATHAFTEIMPGAEHIAMASPYLRFSADGSRVAYRTSFYGASKFHVFDVQSGTDRIVTSTNELGVPGLPDDGPPRSWHGFSINATGTRIAFASVRDITGLNPDRNFEMFLANEPPRAKDDHIVTAEDTDGTTNVLDNDVDPYGGTLSVLTLGSLPEHGIATFHNNGKVVYHPEDNYFGPDSFTYVVEDTAGFKSTGTVFVNVLSVNDPVLIDGPETATVNEDESLVFAAAGGNGISISDIDVGIDYLEVTLTVTGGQLALGDASGTVGDQEGNVSIFVGELAGVNAALDGLAFTPDENYNGPATIEIRVHDLAFAADDPTAKDTHTVSITVLPVNDAPVALPDVFDVDEDDSLAGNVLASNGGGADFDVDGDALAVDPTPATLPTHGQLVVLNPDGSFVYQPDPNFNGDDWFEYVVSDPSGEEATARVDIHVHAVNDAPSIAVPGAQTGYEDVALVIQGISVTDVDAAEGTGLVQLTLGVSNGTLHLNAAVPGGVTSSEITGDGTRQVSLLAPPAMINTTLGAGDGLTYLPDLDFHGMESLRVEASDLGNFGSPGPLSDLNTVAIQVLSAAEQAAALTQSIDDLVDLEQLSAGNAHSLSGKLDAAQRLLQQDQPVAAYQVLQAFQNEVQGLAAHGIISPETADSLLDADEIILEGVLAGLNWPKRN